MRYPWPRTTRSADRGSTPASRPSLDPPPKGMPLGVLLGLILALVVSVVLGLTTLPEQYREIAAERHDRATLLIQMMQPLAAELEALPSNVVLRDRLDEMLGNREGQGVAGLAIVLRDGAGRVVTASGATGAAIAPEDVIVGRIPLRLAAVPGGEATMEAWSRDDGFAAELKRRWRAWWIDLGVMSLAVVVAVMVAVHALVGRPLGRLVRGIERLKNGHGGRLEPGAGAWEIRWLAWRFQRLGGELEHTARQLVAAERRASDERETGALPLGDRTSGAVWAGAADPANLGRADERTRRDLEATISLLQRLGPDDVASREMAEEAWTRSAALAERIGDPGLKARIEDAALRILEPEAFADLDRRLSRLRRSRAAWIDTTIDRFQALLAMHNVELVEVQHRIKHTAGVWRKMRELQLTPEQVHDVFAFRLIVPDEASCYRALGVLHRGFDPVLFRFKDYIEHPKANGYRSLHTSVRDDDGNLFEVQIRTPAMHFQAEAGDAAHWLYRDERWSALERLGVRRRSWWRRLRPA
jgi:hypothetical protein